LVEGSYAVTSHISELGTRINETLDVSTSKERKKSSLAEKFVSRVTR